MRSLALILPLLKSVSFSCPRASATARAWASVVSLIFTVTVWSGWMNFKAISQSSSSNCTPYGRRMAQNSASVPTARSFSTANCASLPANVESWPPEIPNTKPLA